MQTFRSAAAALAFSAFEGGREVFREAAEKTVSSVDRLPAPRIAASHAAATTVHDRAAREGGLAVRYALEPFEARGQDDLVLALRACASDAEKLDRSFSPVKLAMHDLWPSGSPSFVARRWGSLKDALQDDSKDWSAWGEWYQDRLAGAPLDEALEVARAKIPNQIWREGPSVANRLISEIHKYHQTNGTQITGLDEQTLFALKPVERPIIGAREPSVGAQSGEDDLAHKFADLSIQQMAVIGVRAVLRALPLMSSGHLASTPFLTMLRVASLTWTAVAYPDRTPNVLGLNAARVDAINNGDAFVRAVAATSAGYSPNQFDKVIEEVALGIRSLRAAATQLDGDAGAAVLDLALSQDLNDLSGAPEGATALAQLELWPGGAPPEWMARRWDALKRHLIGRGLGWEVWVNWYEDRLAGRVRSEAHELVHARVPDPLWEEGIAGDPAVVNTWIMRQFDRLADQALDDPPTSDTGSKPPPTIPAQQPAAIEPVWSNGRLTLPKAATKSDLKGRGFAAALKSLREEMRAFADDIAGEANIDPRYVAYIRKIADQIPQKSPRQAELFRLGHAGEVFAGYATTVDDEWPQVLAKRFHALALHFDRTMRQSPLWREFKRKAAQEHLTAEQIGTAASLATFVATALRDDEAAAFTDPAIPQTLEGLAEPLRATGERHKDTIEAGEQELALDVVESVSNILKRIAEGALAAKALSGTVAGGVGSTLRDAGVVYARELGKGVKRAAKRQGPKDGEKVFKWLRRAAIAAGGYGVGAALGLPQLIAAYPPAFAWLQALLKHFP